ncbi:alpha/beta fold hydrolase [Nonomuraea angiospora]|uniref:alpha/beta fold hydrolase n=1 Tax=Nonomuraea angiospora TaxID=46172 RepID=UPI00332E85EF
MYRSLLRDRRVLVVLDNAASEEQVRRLLPGGGAGRVLVTSRRLPAGLEGVRRLSMGPLPLLEATELLTGIVGERSVSDGEPALTQLAQLCGGLPLALRIIGNRLVSRPGWSAADLPARHKPSWYLVATEDRMIPPPAQRAMAERAGSSVVEAIDSHAVYVSQPATVADLIRQAAT